MSALRQGVSCFILFRRNEFGFTSRLINNSHIIPDTLNGNNGSWTNTDDVEGMPLTSTLLGAVDLISKASMPVSDNGSHILNPRPSPLDLLVQEGKNLPLQKPSTNMYFEQQRIRNTPSGGPIMPTIPVPQQETPDQELQRVSREFYSHHPELHPSPYLDPANSTKDQWKKYWQLINQNSKNELTTAVPTTVVSNSLVPLQTLPYRKSEPPRLKEIVPSPVRRSTNPDWALSPVRRNKAQHAAVGNMVGKKEKKLVKAVKLKPMKIQVVKTGPRPNNQIHSLKWSHKELVKDVSGTSAFGISSLSVNFRNASMFPFAKRLADNFDRYKISNLVVHYETTSSDTVSTTTNAIGTVYLAFIYDPDDPAPTTEEEITTIDKWVSGKPSVSFNLRMSSNLNKVYFLRGGDGSLASDPRLEDPCVLQIATIGCPFTTQIGKIWVSYDVEFLNPRLTSAPSKGNYSLTHISAATSASPFGSSSTQVLAASSDFNVTYQNNAGTTYIKFPIRGRFIISVYWVAATSVGLVTDPIWTGTGGSVLASVMQNSSAGGRGVYQCGSTSSQAGYIFAVDVKSTADNLTITDPVIVGTCVCELLIVGVSNEINVDIMRGMTDRMVKLRTDLRKLENSLRESEISSLPSLLPDDIETSYVQVCQKETSSSSSSSPKK